MRTVPSEAVNMCERCPFRRPPKATDIENTKVRDAVLAAYNDALPKFRPGEKPVLPSEIHERDRSERVARARQIIMYVLIKSCERSLPHVGKFLGGRDHTTVMSGRDKIQEMRANPFVSCVLAGTFERLGLTSPAS